MTAAITTPPGSGSDDPGAPDAGYEAPEAASGSADDGPAEEPTGPAPQPGPPPASSTNRFLLWLRGLDLARRPGWIGGVCAGIAERLGIDPLIVRGVFVVVAVLGGPAFLFYAAAWLLLPDQDDALPIERLLHGRLDRVHAGIGALVLASMLPVAQGFWSFGGAFTGAAPWAPSAGRALWTTVVVALVVVFVLWIARRSGRSESTAAPSGAAASTAAPGTAAPGSGPATSAADPASAPLLPPQRPTEARPESPEDIAEWRERQAAWKAEREAFRAQQAATARETAQARAEESRRQAQAITAARLERQRLHRAAHPRLRKSVTLLALGAAALVGSLTSLSASGSTATVVGWAVAALVLGLVIVVSGLLRRRAALLIAVSMVAVLTSATASLLPPDRTMIWGSGALTNSDSGSYGILAGHLQVTADPLYGDGGGVLDVWQGVGSVSIDVDEGAAVRIESTSSNSDIWVVTGTAEGTVTSQTDNLHPLDGRSSGWTRTFGDPAAEPLVVRIEQGEGSIAVYDWSAANAADTGATTSPSTDSPSTTSDPGAAAGSTTTDTTETAR